LQEKYKYWIVKSLGFKDICDFFHEHPLIMGKEKLFMEKLFYLSKDVSTYQFQNINLLYKMASL